jgi:hypothetical protein
MKRTFVITICCTTSALVASAQNFAIERFTIAGGGGISAGTDYVVRGTIAQPDASNRITNGAYTLVGGFWSGATVVPTPGAPRLHIAREQNGDVRLWWANNGGVIVIEETTALAPNAWETSWRTVPAPYQTNAGTVSVTLPPSSEVQMFRLSIQ